MDSNSKIALLNTQENLFSIFDILSIPGAGEEPTNILVEGKLSTLLGITIREIRISEVIHITCLI